GHVRQAGDRGHRRALRGGGAGDSSAVRHTGGNREIDVWFAGTAQKLARRLWTAPFVADHSLGRSAVYAAHWFSDPSAPRLRNRVNPENCAGPGIDVGGSGQGGRRDLSLRAVGRA